MTSSQAQPVAGLMSLPVELRVHIYLHVLDHRLALTVSTAQLTGSLLDIARRLSREVGPPIPSIPKDHVPVVEPRYNPSLLSLTAPARVPATDAPRRQDAAVIARLLACPPLLLVSRQLTAELQQHLPGATRRRDLSLFVALPHGLSVLDSLPPQLLSRARAVHFAGAHCSHSRLPSLAQELLCRSQRVDRFDLRVFFPGLDSADVVWRDPSSPPCELLGTARGGDITVEVASGKSGLGVSVCVRPREDGKRVVSLTAGKIEYGGLGVDDWIVDPAWAERAQ